jgi:hypothetical protein
MLIGYIEYSFDCCEFHDNNYHFIHSGIFSGFFLFSMSRGLVCCINPPNLEDQVIFDQDFLPLALYKPISDCKAAVLVLVHPECFISPVPAIPGEHYPNRHQGRRPMED